MRHTRSCCGQSWQKRRQYFVAVLKPKLPVQKDFVNIKETIMKCKDHITKVQSEKKKLNKLSNPRKKSHLSYHP